MNQLTKKLLMITLIVILAGCSEDKSIIDPIPADSFPAFQSIALSTYAFDTDTISVSGQRTPDDPIQINLFVKAGFRESAKAHVQKAFALVRREGSLNTLTKVQLPLYEPIPPYYGGLLPINIKRGDVGDYSVEVTGTDDRGFELNSVRTKFNVINGVNPPVINCAEVPDTLQLPLQGSLAFMMKVCVKDPSGRADIKRVWFNSYDPNNKPNNNNPFIMYDDGTHGDTVANDGTYSLTVQLPSTTTKGKYRFEFQAFDYGNLGSNVVTKYIYVI